MRVKKNILKKQDLNAVVVLEDIFSDFSNCHEKCRLCFKEAAERNSRIQITDDIQNKIHSVLQIHLSYDGIGSDFICSKCENNLNISHQFTFKVNEKLKCYEKFSSKKVEHSDADDELPVPFQENLIKVEDELNLSTEMELVSPMSEIKEESSEDGSPSESEGGKNEETIERQKQDQSNPQFVPRDVGGQVLKNGDTFQRRQYIRDFNSKFHCDICGKTMKTKSNISIHLNIHKEFRTKEFHCHICESSYLSQPGLQRHILKNHEKSKHLTCSLCGIIRMTEKGLENHKLHPCLLPCEICGKMIRKNIVKRHMNEVHCHKEFRTKEFHCHICESSYFSQLGLQKHILKNHEKSKHLTCSLCGRISMTEKALKRHKLRPCRLPCEVCGKMFTMYTIKRHMNGVHFNLKPIKCYICDKIICKNNFAKHMTTHNDLEYRRKDHYCQICGRSFFNKAALKIHTYNVHEKPKHLTCSLCGRICRTEEGLKKHKLRPHYLPCEICGKTFRKDRLKEHLNGVHFKIKRYQCDICGNKFDKKYLARHMTTHLDLEHRRKEFHCQICESSYFDKETLQRHVLSIHERSGLFTCSICSNNFRTEKGLKNHKFRPCRLPCEVCGKMVKKERLKRHLIEAHFQPYQCDICGNKCSSKSVLARHMITHIDLEHRTKEFHCQICEISYFNKKTLRSHTLKYHEKSNHFTCSLCGRIYMTEKGLENHKLRPCRLPCEFCGKMIRKEGLKEHLNGVHFNIKPYQCDICGNKFCKPSLARHMNTHVGLQHRRKEFHCQICESSYFDKAGLKRHILNMHERPSHLTCSICGITCWTKEGLKKHKLRPHRLSCDFCEKRFSTKHSLQIHQNMHRERNLAC
ncbi:CLUMA_CG009458, isoform A [Clunio marinus]|uniref:CLUMA_CG009458, isoform A n=1 Tax=Clunio marinus TaxID=568069 RepID=A0A1J1I8G4_9DIPT|nr:CLUMA_CG009458, isoform A [Clunio marinus]